MPALIPVAVLVISVLCLALTALATLLYGRLDAKAEFPFVKIELHGRKR